MADDSYFRFDNNKLSKHLLIILTREIDKLDNTQLHYIAQKVIDS